MAVLRKSEIKKLKPEEIDKKIKELRIEILTLKAKIAAGGSIEDAGKLKPLRRTIARLQTYQRLQQLEAASRESSLKSRRKRTKEGLRIETVT